MKLSRVLRAAALLAVLSLHYWTRLHAARTMPLEERAFYPHHYTPALSLLAGRGFNGLALGPTGDPRPEAHMVARFLRLRRDDVPARRFEAYAQHAVAGELAPESLSRVLDVYVAAAVWGIFGISWPALFHFYVVLSTLTCLLVFLLGRRVGGAFGTGLAAAILFLASPFENEYVLYSLRDVSPLWFVTLGAFLVLCAAPGSERRLGNALWWTAVGAAGALGFGWRPDGVLIVAFVLAALAVRLWSRRRPAREILAAIALSALGAATAWYGIRTLGGSRPYDPGIGFHIAYYGEFTRSNVLGIENSFETLRNDTQTAYQVSYFSVARGEAPVTYGRPGYNAASRALYLEAFRYNVYNWLAGFPRFFLEALGGLSAPGMLQGQALAILARDRLPALHGLYRWILDPLTRAGPYLLLFGCAHAFWRGPDRNGAALLAAFAAAYAWAMLAVLPENKHFGPLLLPLAVLGGVGITAVASIVRAVVGARSGVSRAVGPWRPPVTARTARHLTGVALALILVLLAAREQSVAVRRRYLDDIRARLGKGVDVSDLIRAPRVFSVSIAPGQPPDPAGYLLTIQAAPEGGMLVCRHFRGVGDEPAHRLYSTRHRLRPAPIQHFFVATLQGAAYDDARTYVCTVTVDPGARIVSATRLDLATWKRPLFGTLFHPGDRSPGAPSLGRTGTASDFAVARVKDADRFGLLPEEAGYWSDPPPGGERAREPR